MVKYCREYNGDKYHDISFKSPYVQLRLIITSKSNSFGKSTHSISPINMKEVIVHPLPTLTAEIHDVPLPVPESDQAIIKVAVAGSNVKGKFKCHALSVRQG